MKRREAGFTIISVLLAIVMLSFGVLALARTSGIAMRAQSRAALRTQATSLARAYMENVRGRDPSAIVTEAEVNVDETGVVDPAGVFTRSVHVDDVRTNLKRITVVVKYPGSNIPVELVTLAYVGTN